MMDGDDDDDIHEIKKCDRIITNEVYQTNIVKRHGNIEHINTMSEK